MLKAFQKSHFLRKLRTNRSHWHDWVFAHDGPKKIDIAELYSRLTGGQVKNYGQTRLVKCCFHEEKTPSLALYIQTSSYYCFACSKHGDAISFVEEVLHCNFTEALKYLHDNGF
jgi:DNA primase